MTIIRRAIVHEEIALPPDTMICPSCEGKGLLSRYDEGWQSILFNRDLAALRPCVVCGGDGYIPRNPKART